MTTSERTILNQLTELDPARRKSPTSADAIERTRRWVLEHEAPKQDGSLAPVTPIRRTRRRVAMVGAAAVLVLGLVGVLPSAITDTASTAPAAAIPMLAYSKPEGLDARAELEQFADRIRGTAAPAAASGQYAYNHIISTGTYIPADDGTDKPRVPYETEGWSWVSTVDGSARTLLSFDGELEAPQDHPAGFHNARPAFTGSPQEVVDRFADTDPAERKEHDRDGWSLVEKFFSYSTTFGQYPPEERAAFLDALATTGAVSYGTVTDRAGREGVAYGAAWEHDGIVDEHRIILDPVTGEVLAMENIQSGDLTGVPEGEVVENTTTLLESHFTDELPECGDVECTTMSSEED